MINRKFMLMAIFLVSLLAVSAVSANELNATDEVAIDDEDLIAVDVSEDISADSQEEVIGVKDAGTFTALQNKINNANEGSTITLENDYKYDDGFDSKGIDIDKPVTIDGKGYTIDANSKARIFYIRCSGVVLNNINFKNAYLNDWDAEGCAIYAYGGLTLNHCNFMNNNIDESCTRYSGGGGVIFTKNRLNLNDCVFNENYGACSIITTYHDTSGSYGSSGRNYDLNINKCVFDSNKGDYIIYATDTYNLMVNNSVFTNSESSVIDAFKSNVYNSRFENNGGTAISLTSTSVMELNNEIVNCSFIGNSFGGAVRAYHNFYTHKFNLKVLNCDFIDNVRGHAYLYAVGRNCDGGAIYGSFIGSMLEVDNCRFINNFAYDRGGAIYNTGGTVVKNSEFRYNNAMNGGGIYNCEDTTTVSNCIFEKNYADKNGTAMYGGSAIGCTFIDSISTRDNVVFKGTTTNCIFKTTVSINADDVNKYYGESKDFIVILTTSDEALSFKDVKITVNDKTSTVKTDSNGKASIPLNLPVGTHNVVVEYEGVSKTSKVTVKSTITASDMTGTYSNAKATATFLNTAGKALANTKVTFKIGTSSYSATTNSNGVASADIPLGVGTYTVTVVNPTSKEEKQFKLTISKASSTTALTASQNGKSVTLTATVTPTAVTGKVTFEINGKTKEASISNGKASVTFSDLSENTYPAKATYSGDSNFKSSSASTSVKVDKVYSITNVGDTKGTYLDSKVSATFLDANGKALANTKVTFRTPGKTFSATTNSNGVATAKVDLDAGTYDVTAVNPNTKEEKQFKLTIEKATPDFTLKASKTSGVEGMVTITATFTQNTVTGEVKVSGEGSISYAGTITNGQAIINTLYAPNVAHDVTVRYSGDNNFKAVEKTFSFTASDANPVLTAENISLVYGNNKDLVVSVNDADGTPIANKDISLRIYIDTYRYYSSSGQSDENGQLKVSTKGLEPNNYLVKINSDGCKEITAKIIVKKATPKITASKKTFKVSVKTKKYTMTLKTNKNKVMKNKKVTLTVNGKKYSAKTNSNGKATFKITKLTKKGTFSAVVKFAGNSYYNKVTKTVKITVKK